MKTYTYGRTPNMVIKNALPHKYSMELNKMDMMRLLKVLTFVSFNVDKFLRTVALSCSLKELSEFIFLINSSNTFRLLILFPLWLSLIFKN